MEEAFAWAYQRIELHGLAGRKYVAKGRLIAAMIAYGIGAISQSLELRYQFHTTTFEI
eukprot:COSAG05_NODE_89_length_20177_cov_197.003586_9_plen_58_part_00